MSLILEKRVLFLKNNVSSFEKNDIFLRHFHWKRVNFWWFKSAVLNKKGSFFAQEISVKGVIFLFGERSYVPPFTCEWPDRALLLARCLDRSSHVGVDVDPT